MKKKLFTVVTLLSAVLLNSCKKQEIESLPLASLMIVNVVNGGGNLLLGTNVLPVYNNYFQAYSMPTGSQRVKLLDTADMDQVYYDQTVVLENGGLYSLFLTGNRTAVESVIVKEENIPSHTTDAFGARVINLVDGGAPISLNLADSANGSFVPSLSYMAISNFKEVSSKTIEGDKTFEIRNASTGVLLTTFTVPGFDLPRFRNITLVVAGIAGSEFIIRINNY